jgi:acyl carrier protein
MGWFKRLFAADSAEPAREDAAPAAALDVEPIIAFLRSRLAGMQATAISVDAIDVNANFYQAGYLDSRSAAEFLVSLEAHYGVELPDWLLGIDDANTIAGLSRQIAQRVADA